MKWIGQHIYDLISRFRNDIYLENISSGTIASGGNLGLDSNNKIVKQDDTGITDLHGAGVDGSNNQLLTDDGDGTITSEANLTFDGSTLSIEADANTTQHALFIDMDSTTTGNAISVDIDHSNTGSISTIGQQINLAKAGVTSDGASSAQFGFALTQYDGATNHANSTVTQQGVRSTVASASDSGTNKNTGIYVESTGATTNLGIDITTTDSADITTSAGIINRSSADTGDYFAIMTGGSGRTDIHTVDDDGENASLVFHVDGGIFHYAKSAIHSFSDLDETDDGFKFTNGTNGLTTFTTINGSSGIVTEDARKFVIEANGVEIDNASDSGDPALRIDNDDIDEVALQIDAQNRTADVLQIDATDLTTSNVISIDANNLTTGNAIFVDVDSALTDTNTLDCMKIDYDKSGNAASGQTVAAYGLEIDMNDNATSNVGNTQMTGIHIGIDSANANGLALHTGVAVQLTDADTALTTGFSSFVENGGVDFKAMSSADSGDYFTIATTTHGATTLTTVDDDAAAANFTVRADGIIKLEAEEDFRFYDISSGTTNTDDYLKLTIGANGDATFETVDAAGAAAHVELAADGNITLDAAGDIALEAGGNDVSIVAGDLTMYDAVNDGNPTVRIGSSAANNFEIKPVYNSGAQTIDSVDFTTYTQSSSSNDGRYRFFVDEVELVRILDGQMFVNGSFNAKGDGAFLQTKSETASSATEGGKLRIICDDGAAMGNDHRLGVVQFEGAEDASSNFTVGAQIEAFCEAAWSSSENGGRLVFSTTDGNASTSTVLTLDSNKLATFDGDLAVGGDDVTIYNAVNDSNPTISLGSSATNRFEIKSLYNSSAQTIDSVDFTTYTTSSTANDGRYRWFVDEVELAKLRDDAFDMNGMLNAYGSNAVVQCSSSASSATDAGPEVNLIMDDGAAMADNHRLGIIGFYGAEDASNNRILGASIESFCDAAWSASENGARMVFSTTDGNASTSTVLTLDSDKKATFTGPIACTTRTLAVTSSTDGDANGDVVYFGGTTSMTVGKIYHYKSDGTWEIANADAVATADGLLGVALGAASDTNGMLLRGMVTLDHDPGAIGDVLYVQSDNAGTPGNATATAPSASGDCVRIIGYQVSHASNGNIWFNPDNTFVEVA